MALTTTDGAGTKSKMPSPAPQLQFTDNDAARGRQSSISLTAEPLSETASRSSVSRERSPSGKKNRLAKFGEKLGGLFGRKDSRRGSVMSQSSDKTRSSFDSAPRDSVAPSPALQAESAGPSAPPSILILPPQSVTRTAVRTPTSPTEFTIPVLAVHDHDDPPSNPTYIDRTPLSPQPTDTDTMSDSSSDSESDTDAVFGSAGILSSTGSRRGRKDKGGIGGKVSGWFRRLSLSPMPPGAGERMPRVMTEPSHEIETDKFGSLGIPAGISRSRSVGGPARAEPVEHQRKQSDSEFRPSITFDVSDTHKPRARSKEKDRRNSIFSLFSGNSNKAVSDKDKDSDTESNGGSFLSFGRRRTKTEGSIQFISPFVEPPLPPLILSGRYKDTKPVLDTATAEGVRKHLPRRLREAVKWPLLYSMDMHGFAFSSFYMLTADKGPTIWAIEDTKGVVFGLYVSEDVRLVPDGKGFYGSGERLVSIMHVFRSRTNVSCFAASCGRNCHRRILGQALQLTIHRWMSPGARRHRQASPNRPPSALPNPPCLVRQLHQSCSTLTRSPTLPTTRKASSLTTTTADLSHLNLCRPESRPPPLLESLLPAKANKEPRCPL